jgi:hypothetical protein
VQSRAFPRQTLPKTGSPTGIDRRGIVIFVTGIVVGLAVRNAVAQERTGMHVNHVGVQII